MSRKVFCTLSIATTVVLIGLLGLLLFNYETVSSSIRVHPVDLVLKTGIETVKIDFSGEKVYLKVQTSKPLSCKTVIELLNIEDLRIKERILKPTCKEVNGTAIHVIYTEYTSNE